MALSAIHLPRAPRFTRTRRLYTRACSIRVPGWLNFTADSLHRAGGDTADLVFQGLGRRLRPAWPAWSLAGVTSTVACSTVMFGLLPAAPVHAATAVTIRPAAHVVSMFEQQRELIATDQQAAATSAGLAAVPHISQPTAQLLSTAVSRLPDGKTMASLDAQAIQQAYYGPPVGIGAFEQCVISRESGGNAQVMNASGHYGLFQMTKWLWTSNGGKPADFGHATVAEQQAVFNTVMGKPGGAMNWTPYDGCIYGSGGVLAAYSVGANPLRAISGLVVGRIDEGQDFCGSGPLYAIGTGVIRQVWGGWPGGVYILEYVTSGGAAGRYIYFAESISPKVYVGQQVNSSTEVGYMYNSPTCIEIGWGTSTQSTPLAWGHYVEGQPTAEGYSMAAFLRSL